ncbi:heparan sulfate 2-O-sulfotransferase pipe-like [Argiope bruennichi]|uniref:heparan sulfate 2-O-sulfotransferase pipe-like n=1 Tax=Argiope bruennichi TaxID=94029 RepID=UPI002495100A|nr:heparan sulfate 2-O-sulfotransferase pipe-like [Argiope bruennichi]
MKYSSVLVEEFKPTRTFRFFPRCIVLTFIAGIVFYCVYSIIQVPVNEITSGRLQSGSIPCDCPYDISELESIDRQRLFYNRVPKCGSTTLITLIRKLAVKNNYIHFNSKIYDRKNVGEEEQRRIVKQVKSTPSPCSFDRHVFFINFTKFGQSPPIFINIIREPVERIISSFFYRRMVARQNKTKVKPSAYWLNKKFEHCVLTPDPECTFLEGHNYSVLQLPYFCGQEPECQMLNDDGALQKAKQNIEKYYAVVGTLEDMNMTLQVLEAVLPHFFRGAYHVYHNLGVHRNQNLHKEHVKEEVKEVLRANLTAEYELYYFVQQRLYQQYQTLVEETQKNQYKFSFTSLDQLLDYQ